MKRGFGLWAVIGAVTWGVFSLSAPVTLSAQATKSQWDGIFTGAQASRGEAIYELKCVNCHLADLTGGEPEYTPSPALAGGEFTDYWNNRTIGDLFEAVQMLPKDDPGTLTPQEAADLIAYIMGFNKYPAGTTELSGNAATLKAIKFLAKKPGA